MAARAGYTPSPPAFVPRVMVSVVFSVSNDFCQREKHEREFSNRSEIRQSYSRRVRERSIASAANSHANAEADDEYCGGSVGPDEFREDRAAAQPAMLSALTVRMSSDAFGGALRNGVRRPKSALCSSR